MSLVNLAPVYLLVGTHKPKIDATLHRLAAYIPEDLASFNLLEIRATSAYTVSDLSSALNGLPLMSEKRIVIIREAHQLNAEAQTYLLSYAAEPNLAAVVALQFDTLARNTKLYKALVAVHDQTLIDCSIPQKRELDALVDKMALQVGVTLAPRARTTLIERVGARPDVLQAALVSLSVEYAGQVVDEIQVRERINRFEEAQPWPYLDALCERNALRVIDLVVDHIASAPRILSLVIGRMRDLLVVRSHLESNQADLLPGALHKETWLIKKYIAFAEKFTTQELIDIFADCARVEARLKRGADAYTELLRLSTRIARGSHKTF